MPNPVQDEDLRRSHRLGALEGHGGPLVARIFVDSLCWLSHVEGVGVLLFLDANTPTDTKGGISGGR